MKAFPAAFVVAMSAFASLVAPAAWAQGHADHIMVGPKDLKWADVPSLPAGGVAIMQPRTNHFAWTDKETIVQVHGVGPWSLTYVNPADDPRKK